MAKESAVLVRAAQALGFNGAASCRSACLNRNSSKNVGNGATGVWNGASVTGIYISSGLGLRNGSTRGASCCYTSAYCAASYVTCLVQYYDKTAAAEASSHAKTKLFINEDIDCGDRMSSD